MIPFILNTKAEIVKIRKTPAVWVTVLGALFIPLVNLSKCIISPDTFIPRLQADPWGMLLEYNWQIAAGFLLIMYVILLNSLVVQIEYRNSTWKQVYASPRSYADIFFSKLLTIHLLITSCFLLFNVMIVVSGYAIDFIQPEYGFRQQSVPFPALITTTGRMYGAILAISAIQYWLSLRLRNFVVPLGIGLFLFTLGFMIRQWPRIDLYPYMYPFLVYFKNPGHRTGIGEQSIINSLVWFAIVTIAAFIDLSTMKEKYT